MIVDAIRRAVKEECSRPGALLGLDFYSHHLEPAVLYSAELAARLGGDPEISAVSAWLHDISAVRDFATLPHHAELSALQAEDILRAHLVPPDRIKMVCSCIRSHSTPLSLDGNPVEAVILSNADAVAQIAQPGYWSYFAFGIRRLGFEEGRQWLASLVESKYSALIEPARAIAASHYARARAIFAADPHQVSVAG